MMKAQVDRSAVLANTSIDKANERLSFANGLIRSASEKRDRVTGLLGRRDVSPDTIGPLLAEVARNLGAAKEILEDNKWNHGEARESLNIVATLDRALAVGVVQLHRSIAPQELDATPSDGPWELPAQRLENFIASLKLIQDNLLE